MLLAFFLPWKPAVAARGKFIIQRDVVSADPDPKVSAAGILKAVETGFRSGPSIIMHAYGRGRHTAEALPEIIAYWRKGGLTPGTVSVLLGLTPKP